MNTKEIKRRINVIDVLIILFVLLVVVASIYRLNTANKINIFENSKNYELEFIIQNIQEASQDFLTPGETFYIMSNDLKIGEIKEILEIRTADAYSQTIRGEIKKSETPRRIDVIGVLSATGKTIDDTGFFLNGNIFTTCGKEFLVHTQKLEVTIMITSVKEVE